MTIRYFPVTPDIKVNGDTLAEGVRGISCVEVRKPTDGERLDYTPFLPWGCFLSSVEVYANGARNFYVRAMYDNGATAGYLIIRPLEEVASEKAIDNYIDSYDVD
jgi:hypothetical protein